MATAATRKPGAKPRVQQRETPGITRVTVSGYKSVANETSIDIRPLTILAGANSSGKSSIMQPLLLMKQTIEAAYDPGGLKIDGPNVEFDYVDEMLSDLGAGGEADRLHVEIERGPGLRSAHEFRRGGQVGLELRRVEMRRADGTMELRSDMSSEEVRAQLPAHLVAALEEFAKERPGLADVAAI